MINESHYYHQDRQCSTVVKNAGFGVRLSGFLSTLIGYVTLQKLQSLCVCFLFFKNGDKNTHCTEWSRAVFLKRSCGKGLVFVTFSLSQATT